MKYLILIRIKYVKKNVKMRNTFRYRLYKLINTFIDNLLIE